MSVPTYICLELTLRDNVCRITLNRPKRKNAFNNQMYNELMSAFDWCSQTSDVHVVVLTGSPESKPREFYSSGNDLSNFTDNLTSGDLDIPALTRAARDTCEKFVNSFIDFPKPLIAAVNGPAFGIAVTTLQLCDLVYAKDSATFTTPFTQLGQNPEGASSILFPQRLGQKANQMLLLGHTMTAKEADRLNFITGILPDSTFLEDVHKIAVRLASYPIHSVMASKKIVRNQQLAALKAANAEESELLETLLNSPETMEAVMKRVMEMKQPKAKL